MLTDGSIDASDVEKEAVFVRFLDKIPLNSNKVKVFHNFVGLADLDTGKAAGVVTTIENSFRDVHAYDEFTEKIVAFGADGANVNQGEEEGAIAILRRTFGSWIAFIWCVPHRLELVLKDALRGTSFDDMDGLLLHIYYLYEKSPQKLRELQEIHGKCKDIFEFDEGG